MDRLGCSYSYLWRTLRLRPPPSDLERPPAAWRPLRCSQPLVAHGQAPMVSPCARCAGTAFRETVIVTNGFVAECVWWQITTFSGYSYCAAADGVPADRPDAARTPRMATTAAGASRPLNRRPRSLDVACNADARTRAASSGSTRTSSGLTGSNPSALFPLLTPHPLRNRVAADCNEATGEAAQT
jgi:hypothetical protein